MASRSINLCLYLNEGMEGGETSFVRWRNAETDQGLDMKPEKGKAMIFYSTSDITLCEFVCLQMMLCLTRLYDLFPPPCFFILAVVNPDGNRDDLSAHAARPVRAGEKYFANLWIWDPYRL